MTKLFHCGLADELCCTSPAAQKTRNPFHVPNWIPGYLQTQEEGAFLISTQPRAQSFKQTCEVYS